MSEELIFGAAKKPTQRWREEGKLVWTLVRDPIEFATAENPISGSSIEEVKRALSLKHDGQGLLDVFTFGEHGDEEFWPREDPVLLPDANPFDAARAFGKIRLRDAEEPMAVPKGADAAFVGEANRDKVVAWVDGDFAYYGRFRWAVWTGVLHCGSEAVAEALATIKKFNRNKRSREKKEGGQQTYLTLPKSKAREVFRLGVSMVEIATRQRLFSSEVKCSRAHGHSELSRAELLKYALEAWQLADHIAKSPVTSSLAKKRRIDEKDWGKKWLEDIFAPLRENWDKAKHKDDAEHCVPFLQRVWPDEEFLLPKKEKGK